HMGGENGLPQHGDVCIPLVDGELKLVGVLHGVMAPDTELAYDVIDFLSRAGADIGAALGQSLKYKAALEWNQDLVEVNDQLGRQIDDFTLALAHAQEAKTDFLVSMNHELRTPLNPIIGFAQVLLGEYFGELNSKQKEHVQDIFDSGKRLLDLIDEILDLSRAEMGRDELNLSPLNLFDLTASMLKMVKEKAFKHSITIDVSIDEELKDLEIIADETKLKTVVYNLLSNAVKFTPDGGAIQLGAQLLPHGDIDPDGSPVLSAVGKPAGKAGLKKPWLEIFVQDSGYGIGKEDQERIFDEFYQVRNSSMKKPSGSGLGLPLARRFVVMHGGRIWMESEGLGKGSRFVVRIPIGA
ncbi:MAG: HAMP domain-containing sensor histidine kinase, partial [Desulfatibacillaceae bacterium]|nr:HAMP domain-containing sensor histidine kinase [Desulfatibacillaceae bacterium]